MQQSPSRPLSRDVDGRGTARIVESNRNMLLQFAGCSGAFSAWRELARAVGAVVPALDASPNVRRECEVYASRTFCSIGENSPLSRINRAPALAQISQFDSTTPPFAGRVSAYSCTDILRSVHLTLAPRVIMRR